MKFNRRRWIMFIGVGIFIAVLRLLKVDELGYFMLDEERDAFLVRRMLVDRRPLLIGGAIPGGINVGPLFFYISAIPYYFSLLNPIGPAYAAGVVGVIGVIGTYWVGKELLGRRAGLLGGVFAAFSLLNIIYQRPWWPLTMSQVVTLAAYLSLWNLIRSDPAKRGQTFIFKNKWLVILVLALIIGAQSDPSTLSLIPLSVMWLWLNRKEAKLTKKHAALAIGLFLLAHTTWILFEFRHNFLNTRAAIGLLKVLTFADAKVRPYGFVQVFKMTEAAIYRLFIPTGPLDVTKQISPAPEYLNVRLGEIWWPGAILIFIAISYWVINSIGRGSMAKRLIGLHILISFGGILLYTSAFPGYVHEWMWAFMFPAFFLIAADVLVSLEQKCKFKKYIRVRSFANFSVAIWAVWQLSLFLKLDNVAGLGKKLAVVRAAQEEIGENPYELRSEGEDALRYGGWRYLFTLYGNPPVKSYMDYVYQDWLYPKSKVEAEVILTILNHESIKSVEH